MKTFPFKTVTLGSLVLLTQLLFAQSMSKLYDIPFKDIDGKATSLKPFKGKVLLVVSGQPKRAVLKRLLADRKVSTNLPASFLWLHPALTLICDQAAIGG